MQGFSLCAFVEMVLW